MKHKLTKTQENLLDIFRKAPKRWRHFGRAGNDIKAEFLDSYDARSWNPLFERGYLYWTQYGFNVREDEK